MTLTFSNFLIDAGYLGLFIGVFLETGLLIGIVLPGGETLIFAAGFLASLGYLNLWLVILVASIAAVSADSLEYTFGMKYGPRIFQKEYSLLFDKRYLEETRKFFEKYGGKTIMLARFLPFIRTLAPAFAGVGEMRYSHFVGYNIAGAVLWSIGFGLLGYYLGKAIPNADQYVIMVVLAVSLVSVAISLVSFAGYRNRRSGRVK